MPTHTILGAGGVIANGLAKELTASGERVILVSRNPNPYPGAAIIKADITDPQQAQTAIGGADIVYLCIGLKYDYAVWRQQWPKIMTNIIEACKRTGAKLIFFDNVYMYGRTDGAMTEDTPYDPISRKGDLRARIATQLMSEVRKGNITATIARAADFYGPAAGKTSVPGILVFDRLAKGKRAQWLVNPEMPHSFTYVGDAVKGLVLLARDENSWNQAWHLPTSGHPPTGSTFVELAARGLHVNAKSTVLPKWMIRLGGLLDRTTAELREMLYQYEFEYLFDSSKFEKEYHYTPVSYEEGIQATAGAYRS